MKLLRFATPDGEEKTGLLEEGTLVELTGGIFSSGERTESTYDPSEVRLLPPLRPGKIVCIGFNYRKHMDEMQDIATKKPTLTLKSPGTVIGSGDPIVLPRNSGQVEHEAELGIIIGKGGFRIKDPEKHIHGYTVVNDVTARDVERDLTQWSASKSFPTFCPLGPVVETCLDPRDLTIKCRVNGKLRQDDTTASMIYDAFELVRFVSSYMELFEGDLIATGTVPGVGLLSEGDMVEVEIRGIGVLKNRVVSE